MGRGDEGACARGREAHSHPPARPPARSLAPLRRSLAPSLPRSLASLPERE
jgi:hypothetical protein